MSMLTIKHSNYFSTFANNLKKYTMRILKPLALSVLILFISSCGLTNMANKYDEVRYTTTPPILETHAGQISLDIEGVFPPKYFAKKATIEITPVLVSDNGEKEFKKIILQGEEASGGEKTIFFENGGKFSYSDDIIYDENMRNSNLEIRATAKMKNPLRSSNNSEPDTKELGPIKIANGVIATSRRIANNEETAYKNHGYEHETILEEKATIYFLVNQSNIRPTETSDEDIKKIKEFAAKGYKTHSIEIISYASPEGSVNTNENVSKNRMQSTLRYTKRLLKSANMDGANNNDLYTEKSVGEDWEGFESIVKKSQIRDKRTINRIVNSVEDLELREQQIRDLTEIYDALKDDVLPQLRKATIIIRSYEPKKTDEEIATLSKENPTLLTVNELLFSATLTNQENEKKNIYNSVIKIHNDWRGYNNLACLDIQEGNLDLALEKLEKAEKEGGMQSDILTNKGIIFARKGKIEKAQKLFNQANTSELNQAILDIRQGDYKKATRFFKNKDSYNAYLSRILNNSNKMTPECNENTGACYYLKAIAAARNNNQELVIKNLNNAIASNEKYKVEATEDLEFINYRSSNKFLELIK